ncbi:MAG: YggS family pyridoxal phosphate-dependent enzyme [Actinomycetota bacterium]
MPVNPVDAERVRVRADALRDRLAAAGGDGVRVVAVTKTFGPDAVDAAVAAGLIDIGENYAQEAVAKLVEVRSAPTVHFIGRLQRNKVRHLAPVVDVWQSVDRPELVREIAKRAPGASVMIQVDISDEETKGGVAPADAEALVIDATDAGLEVVGLMGVALLAEPDAARPGFVTLRRLVDQLELRECSMGMTADLEIAVDEGTTMVRVGRDLFGERH